MRSKHFSLIFISILFSSFSLPIVNGAETFTLNPIADSYISSAHSTNNYGTSVSLSVAILESRIENSYLLFDLTSLDSESFDITSARLELYSPSDASPTLEVGVHLCQDTDWDELEINWENAPSFEAEIIDVTSISVGDMYYSWDVTDTVKNAQEDYLTLVLTLESEGENFVFFSAKDSYNFNPQLLVTYELVALPEVEFFELNLDVIGSGFTTPSTGNHSYVEDSEVVVTASTDSGWNFSYWLLDSIEVGNANPYTISIDDNHSLTAVFTEGYARSS